VITIGIDASNLRLGGGITHLQGLIGQAGVEENGIGRLIVWSGRATLNELTSAPRVTLAHDPRLDGSVLGRSLWQRFGLPRALRQHGVDILFQPGGIITPVPVPVVTMSRNLLVFDAQERRRYGWSYTRIRLGLLNRLQRRAFTRADGVIFLSEYARQKVLAGLDRPPRWSILLPHGVNTDFFREPRPARCAGEFSAERPFRWLYVSALAPYKHQWLVAAAAARLRREGLPLAVDFCGPTTWSRSQREFQKTLAELDPRGQYVSYHGHVPYGRLTQYYHSADAFVFASTCENLPNILLEAMASGLPIACSNRSPMPEVLKDAGVYFDPEKPEEIAGAMRQMMVDPDLQTRLATKAHEYAKEYSWEKCARATFAFLTQVAREVRS